MQEQQGKVHDWQQLSLFRQKYGNRDDVRARSLRNSSSPCGKAISESPASHPEAYSDRDHDRTRACLAPLQIHARDSGSLREFRGPCRRSRYKLQGSISSWKAVEESCYFPQVSSRKESSWAVSKTKMVKRGRGKRLALLQNLLARKVRGGTCTSTLRSWTSWMPCGNNTPMRKGGPYLDSTVYLYSLFFEFFFLFIFLP